ncbi:hypothetical protein BJF78_14535 [Pseudonocardia sp. CNS-139]|nr:hypothetical protein BJF78_14535 [Pseudonocardia sp. CNS-139]
MAAGTPVTGMIGVIASRVFSRGRLGLAGDSPHVQPRIEFGMLSDERDAVRMRDGFGRAVQLARHDAVAALTTGVTAAGTPLDRLRDPDALDAWMRASVRGSVHPAGTCRMGAVGDPAAVVDPACRLIGYRDTYVVDASVMPDVPRANTNLTVVALAERIAERLRDR